MKNIIIKNKFVILLSILILAYIGYFSYYTVVRFKTLYGSYYDLGIMDQTVYNTYRAITSFDFSRFLEMTNTVGINQIKRMAIHNDILLALISPLYILYTSPITLLILQSVVSGLGAIAIYKITQYVFNKNQYKNILSIVFSLAYLLYPPMEKANMFDFHAVTLATTLLLFMFYFWLVKKYLFSFIFFTLAILSKEQVALTTAFFGLFIFLKSNKNKRELIFSALITIISALWFLITMLFIIKYFRNGEAHFAIGYFGEYGINKPLVFFKNLFDSESLVYLLQMLGPLGFLSILSPLHLLIATPEFAINLLSSSNNMRNIYFQYSAVLTPFIFIAAIYGVKKLNKVKVVFYILVFTLIFVYLKGPLPFAREKEIHPFAYPQLGFQEVQFWAKVLKDENLKISASGHVAPFFTNRRYYYDFNQNYYLADYIIVRRNEVYSNFDKYKLVPVYEKLLKDIRYNLIYNKNTVQVFKKVASSK